MRLIRRLVLLAIIGAGGVAAYHWSDGGRPLRSHAAAFDAAHITQEAARLANRAAATATVAAATVGGTIGDSALTAKIKSKMALDDRVRGRAIDVDTSGSVVTMTGVVGSADERERAVRLARDTDGVTRVVDRLHVRRP
jgi:hyperosmotically inducible protein